AARPVRQTSVTDPQSAPIASASVTPALSPHATANQIDADHEISCGISGEMGHLTLNGTPIGEGKAGADAAPTIEIGAGAQELWRFVNGADESYVNLALVDGAGNSLPMSIVARDGAPRVDDAGRPLPPETAQTPQLLPPAGRLEFLVTAPAQGSEAYLIS